MLRPLLLVISFSVGSTSLSVSALGADTVPATPSAEEAQTKPLVEQRYHYTRAKQSLKTGKMAEFEQHYQLAGDYPLKVYLDYAKLSRDLDKQFDQHRSALDAFLAQHQNSYPAYLLRKQTLHRLASRGHWQDFLVYYDESVANIRLRCDHLMAQLEHGQADVMQAITDLWVAPASLPTHCDRLFDRWKKAGGLTNDIAWSRLVLALEKPNTSLGRYIGSLMTGEDAKLAQLLLRVHSQPSLITEHALFKPNSDKMRDVIAHGIKRYARKYPLKALAQWEHYEAQHLFTEEISQQTRSYIARRLLHNGETLAAERLISSSLGVQNDAVVEQLIREALKIQDWDKVLLWIGRLDEETQQSDRWRYWSARAYSSILGGDDADSIPLMAREIYLGVAENRSFYGFMAADVLGQEYSLRQSQPALSAESIEAVAAIADMRRARELWLTGDIEQASAEWRFVSRRLNAEQLHAAAELARRWGWHNGSINAMISANMWDNIDLRFPMAYKQEIDNAASRTQLEAPLIYAIARQESAFHEQAKSPVGAMGLMQLMPSTAKETARKQGLGYSKKDLLTAETNILLGSAYLDALVKRYSGDHVLATAAYNAGPHRVKKWLNTAANGMPYDIWIETIPFKETRHYVQNVMAFTVIYAMRTGVEPDLFSQSLKKTL